MHGKLEHNKQGLSYKALLLQMSRHNHDVSLQCFHLLLHNLPLLHLPKFCGALLQQYPMQGHLVSYVVVPMNKKKGLALNRLQHLGMPILKFSFLLPQPLKLPLQVCHVVSC